jgi:hypothetical protein
VEIFGTLLIEVAVRECSCEAWELSCPRFRGRAKLLGEVAGAFGLGGKNGSGTAFSLESPHARSTFAETGATELLLAVLLLLFGCFSVM